MIVRENVKVGDRTVRIETGRIAKQAQGSCVISCGGTVVMVTVCGTEEPRPGTDFLPLSVDYVEKTYAAGKIPGGFFKREGKLRDEEVLTSRLIDRPCRPLFPDGYRNEIQVVATVLSADDEHRADVLALCGASAALSMSPIPWSGPVGGVRVGRVDGNWVANPTYEETAKSDCNLIIAASKDAIVMVEGECKELTEPELVEALFFGHQAVQPVLELIGKLREEVGATKWSYEAPSTPTGLDAKMRETALEGIQRCCGVPEKHERYAEFKKLKRQVVEKLLPEFPEQEGFIKKSYEQLRYDTMRGQVLHEGKRVDGRDKTTVRPISIEVGWLPRVHGSALFTRGETQAIVTTTLGTGQDEQRIDGLLSQTTKRFLLHYNFPPFSVGEVKPMRGPGRREIGHGNLAERAVAGLLPSKEDFPYTLRVVSEITESNGSSSMATVCGAILSLMDAGVPIQSPCAGVAMGLIKEGDDYAILTDILGDEDHLGDMDFKVCGTEKGITAIQMDIKISGLSREILEKALDQAKAGRLHVLESMKQVLEQPRTELSPHAPRIQTVRVKPDQVRLVIGPGGKMIKAIIDQTGVSIDVKDDGTISVASSDDTAMQKALQIIEGLTTEPEVGKTYTGVVKRIEDYGAFLEVLPGSDGLLHISDMDWERVGKVEDVVTMGGELQVMISNIDRDGRIRLSRKELLPKPEGYVERPSRPDNDRPRRDGERGGPRRDRGGDRGGRGSRGGSRDAAGPRRS